MQTLFKSNLFSKSSSKVGAKNFLSGGKKLGSSIVGAARNNIIGFNRTAKAMVPQKKEENENSFIKNYTNFFGSKKTEKILRKNLKLVRDSLVNTFEIARHLKAAIIGITGDLKGSGGKGGGKGGGLFGGIIKSFLGGLLGGAFLAALPALIKLGLGLAAVGLTGLVLKLFNDEKFRDGFFRFIKAAAGIIWGLIYPGLNALLPSFFKDDGSLNMQKFGEDPWSMVGKSLKEVGPEKTLDLLRQEYAEKKASGKFDTLDGSVTRLEEALIRQMRRVEGIIANKEGVKNWDNLKKKELFVRTNEIKEDRLKTDEWRKIQDLPGNDPNKTKLQTAYHKETKRMIKDLAAQIEAKYKKILIEGSPGGNIDESVTNLGKIWKGSEVFHTPAAPLSNEIKNQNVEGTKHGINKIDFSDLYDGSSGDSILNLEPFTFDLSQNQDSSGGITNASSGISPSGNAVTFFASSNSDPTYHKLNALMTFNII